MAYCDIGLSMPALRAMLQPRHYGRHVSRVVGSRLRGDDGDNITIEDYVTANGERFMWPIWHTLVILPRLRCLRCRHDVVTVTRILENTVIIVGIIDIDDHVNINGQATVLTAMPNSHQQKQVTECGTNGPPACVSKHQQATRCFTVRHIVTSGSLRIVTYEQRPVITIPVVE